MVRLLETSHSPLMRSPWAKNVKLANRVKFFLFLALTKETKRTYQSKLRSFAQFCIDEQITPAFPLTEDTLSFYAAHRLATIKYASFRGDLSALRSWHVDMGLPWDISGMRLLERVCRGARKFRGDPKSCSSKQRVTIAKLEAMLDFLDPADRELMTIRTAFSTATQGLLRCGEFAVTGALSHYEKWKAQRVRCSDGPVVGKPHSYGHKNPFKQNRPFPRDSHRIH